jgi:hypothetical protein
MTINGIQYCIYGDSGYNLHPFMEVPYQGSNLSEEQKHLNIVMQFFPPELSISQEIGLSKFYTNILFVVKQYNSSTKTHWQITTVY